MRVSKRGREDRVTLNIFGLVPSRRIYSKQTLSCAARVSLDFTRHLRERAKLQQLYCKRSRNAPALCQPCQRLCREQRNKGPLIIDSDARRKIGHFEAKIGLKARQKCPIMTPF